VDSRALFRFLSPLILCLTSLTGLSIAQTNEMRIAVIDLYGLDRISPAQVRSALTFKEGDRVRYSEERVPAFIESEQHLTAIPGILRARTGMVCCDQGGVIVTVGIEERGTKPIRFRAMPSGSARLAQDIVDAGAEFDAAIKAAILRGDSSEDHSQGHALAHDPATRAIQERFGALANRDEQNVRRVLRSSREATHRALAAYVLGYVTDKQDVVGDLVRAMSDPSDEVRNNAGRTLWVFADARRPVRVPYEPFVTLLSSPVWSDRNKASVALLALSDQNDPQLLSLLRTRALGPLAEIARWQSEGHALPGFLLLSRIAGYSDDDAHQLWAAGNREAVISRAADRK
jgi:hypothetical protein